MTKIYDDSKDVHVRRTIIYVHSADTGAYSDAECSKKLSSADLTEAFKKGSLIVDGATSYEPISCAVANSKTTLTYIVADGTTVTTAVLKLAVSS